MALAPATAAPPLLIIGGEQDSSTPFVLAERTRAAVSPSVLLSSGHYGHSAFAAGSECALDAMRTFLTGGRLPVDWDSLPLSTGGNARSG